LIIQKKTRRGRIFKRHKGKKGDKEMYVGKEKFGGESREN